MSRHRARRRRLGHGAGASPCARAGHDVRLWARDAGTVDGDQRSGENPRYLPGVTHRPAASLATTDAAAALEGADCVLAVMPAQALRDVLARGCRP